jgi:hypothetical protein
MSSTGRPGMTPDEALNLFRIPASASLPELNRAYRRLVLKAHPDHNPDRIEWANRAMRKLTRAYDVARNYLASLRYEEVQRHLDHEIRRHDEFTALFTNIAHRVLDGVFTYYQYGLENPHQRQSGTPRYRYRQALRRISLALDQLERLQVPNPVDGETLSIFTTFAKTFFESMQLDRPHIPTSDHTEHHAYKAYYEGSRALDSAIRRAFFREELSSLRELASPQSLAVSLNAFMTVVTKYSTSSWITETALKLCLLDAFQALLAIEERLPELV